MKKRLALLLTFAMVFTSLPVSSLRVKAEAQSTVAEYQTDSEILSENSGGGYANPEDEVDSVQNEGITLYSGVDYEGKTVTSVTAQTTLSEDGYYPASLEYVLRRYQVKVTYEDKSTSSVSQWYGHAASDNNVGYYYASTSYATLYMYFYNSAGNRVTLNDTTVPVGEYEIRIFADATADDNPLLKDVKFKVLDPTSCMKTPKENQASFESKVIKNYEETWYKIPSDLDETYLFTQENWKDTSYFVGIWKYENGIATQINDAYDGSRGMKEGPFDHTFSGTDEGLYLVLGETYAAATTSGTVSWQKKKEIESLTLETADSYKVWNSDIMSNTSVTVQYKDGSSETINLWAIAYPTVGDGSKTVEGLEATTKNVETIYLAMLDSNGNPTSAYSPSKYADGKTTNWKAWVKDQEEIYATGNIKIAAPSAKTPTLTEGTYENFVISQNNEVYYQFSVDEDKTVEIINNSSEPMHVRYYQKSNMDGTWIIPTGKELKGSEAYIASFYECYDTGTEYLLILSTDTAAEGTLGLYVEGTTKSAAVSTVSVSASDRMTWLGIPVTLSFVGTDGSTNAGTQVIKNWSTSNDSPTTIYGKTKHDEKIIGVLYQGDKQVSIPAIGEEYETWLKEWYGSNITKKQFENFCATFGIDYQPLEPGSYTLKFYLSSIAESNLIGSTSVTVTPASEDKTDGSDTGTGDGNDTSGNTTCTSHKWNAGTVTKAATCTSTGVKTYTCTNSGCTKTKTETIPMTGHSYGAWTTKIAATVLAAEVQQHTCSKCNKTETKSNGTKLAATLSLPGNLSSITVKKGKTVTSALTMAGGDSLVSCTSSNSKILKVNSVNTKTGTISLKAVKAGSAKINIKLKSDSSKIYTYKVNVTKGTVKTTKLTGVASKKTLAKKGTTFSVKPTVVPFTSTQSVTYKSSNKKVATVTAKGVVKAVASGTAKITIQSGSKKTTCTVTVVGIANVKTSLSLKTKKTTTLKPKLYGISGKVAYTSSNVKVATVSEGGKIIALKKGKTTITVKAGNYSCKCKVNVK